MTVIRWIWVILTMSALACGPVGSPSEKLDSQTVEAACGMCKYGVPSSSGCYWSVQWKGDMLVVQGELPTDHENHAPDGMCNVKRKAVVTGVAKSGQFYAKKFELLPPDTVPENPTFTPADEH